MEQVFEDLFALSGDKSGTGMSITSTLLCLEPALKDAINLMVVTFFFFSNYSLSEKKIKLGWLVI